MEPDNAWTLSNRGVTYRMLERYAEALVDLNRALELEPDNTFELRSRGATYRMLERYDEAQADLDQALILQPNIDWYYYQRWLIYSARGESHAGDNDLARAIEIAKETYSKEPSDWRNSLNLTVYLIALGDDQGSLQLVQRAVSEKAPVSNLKETINDLDEFLSVVPDHQLAQKALSLLKSSIVDR